jgi:hypothetical protein
VPKPITVKLPEALHVRLTAAARRRGVSQSALLREALEGYLESAPVEGTFGDLTEDLCGKGSGPPDLSTNDAHLDGYGT